MISHLRLELERYFLLTRPYSWVSVAMVVLLAEILVNPIMNYSILFFDIFFVISLWVSLNLFAEYFSKDMLERGKIRFLIPTIFLLISGIMISFRSIQSLVFFIPILFAFALYSKKNKYGFIGPISFLIRGLMEFFSFFIIITLGLTFTVDILFIGIVCYLITCGRNLVGDIRDYEFDKLTLPRLIGKAKSKIFVVLLYVAAILVYGQILWSCVLIIVLTIFYKDYFNLHRVLVILNSFVLFEIIVNIFNTDLLFFVVFLSLGIILNLLYSMVPRKSNPWKKKFFG
jgi:1,4-dihydroxy-2-naphthoate octaprenyltransferase